MARLDKHLELQDKFNGALQQVDIELSSVKSGILFRLMRDIFYPPTIRSAADVMSDFFTNLEEVLKSWDPTEPMTVDKAIEAGGLQSPSNADKRKIHAWMMHNSVLQHSPNKGEYWTVRITDGRSQRDKAADARELAESEVEH